jgi:hypothetical protein
MFSSKGRLGDDSYITPRTCKPIQWTDMTNWTCHWNIEPLSPNRGSYIRYVPSEIIIIKVRNQYSTRYNPSYCYDEPSYN